MYCEEGTAAQSKPVIRRLHDWTLKEHEVVVSHWPDIKAIRTLLPHRTENAIRSFAGKCNLRRQIHFWTTAEDRVLRQAVAKHVPIKQIMKDLGLTKNQITNRMRYTGLTYPRRARKPTGDALMDSIRARAFELNMSMADLDEECNSGQQFRRFGKGCKISLQKKLKAIRYLDGELSVRWSPIVAE